MALYKHNNFLYSEMNDAVGTDWQGNSLHEGPWVTGKIITGAYREDEEDVITHISWPWSLCHSTTHFWDADAGDGETITLWDCGPEPQTYQNAFYKTNKMWNGDYSLELKVACRPPGYAYGTYFLRCNYSYLPNAFKWYQIYVYEAATLTGETWQYNPPKPLYEFWSREETGKAFVKKVCWEIVGRICHLIQDQGVPAHAHNDLHPSSDYYEDNFMPGVYQNYTYLSSAFSKDLLTLQGRVHPIRYVMYLMNQVSDRFPSDDEDGDLNYQQAYGTDFYGEILNPIYAELTDVTTQHFGGNPPSGLMDIIANYSYVFSIRATASFLYYVYNEFGIESHPPPGSINLSSNMPWDPDPTREWYTLWKQYPANISPTCSYATNWLWKYIYCDGCYGCTWEPWPLNSYGISTTTPQYYRLLGLWNENYNSSSCPYYAPGDFLVSFQIEASNDWGTSTKYPIKVKPVLYGQQWGCPWIFINTDTGIIAENNIFHKSEYQEYAGNDIKDIYKLVYKPKFVNDTTFIQISEPEHDFTLLDNIKMYAIDHPEGSLIGVTENDDIVLYYPTTVNSTDSAVLDHNQDITSYIQYNQQGKKIVKGFEDDSIYAHYNLMNQINLKKLFKTKKLNSSLRNGEDSLAIIGNLGHNPDHVNPGYEQKDWAGFANIFTDQGEYIKYFARRENPADIIIPFSNLEENVEYVDVVWKNDYEVTHFSVVPISYYGYTQIELPLVEAIHTYNGDVLDLLLDKDGYYVGLDSTSLIALKFVQTSQPEPGQVRDYVMEYNGHYIASYSGLFSNLQLNPKNTNNPYTFQLYVNYPNPFNPKTTIKYCIPRADMVILNIYDITGRLVKSLVSEYQKEGLHSIEFDGSNCASGIYFYRLVSGDFVASKKMVLLK
jgi:hypothetical protein